MARSDPTAPRDPPRPSALESTSDLLERVRGGNRAAEDELVQRYLPILQRWAHGRLPAGARAVLDTDDLVQITLIRALRQVHRFEPRREGAFLAYLRRILVNALRDEVRRSYCGPGHATPLPPNLPDPQPSLLEQTIGREAVERYEAALASLPDVQQEAVILRLEFGFTHQEIARAIGSPSANAARMMVTRALTHLGQVMTEWHPETRGA